MRDSGSNRSARSKYPALTAYQHWRALNLLCLGWPVSRLDESWRTHSCVQRSHFPETTLSRSRRFALRLSNLQAKLMRAFDDGSNLLFSVPGFVECRAFIDVLLPILEEPVKQAG